MFTSATGVPLDRASSVEAGGTAGRREGWPRARHGSDAPSLGRDGDAHARLPWCVAAAITGHSKQVYDKHYAKPFRDAEERENVRESLASIGFGNSQVDQKLTNASPGAFS